MIAIDLSMPRCCNECFCVDDCYRCLADVDGLQRSVWEYYMDDDKPDWCPLKNISPIFADNLEVWPCPVHPILGGGTVPTYSFNCPKCGKEHFGINKSYLDTHDFFCDACGQQIIFKERESDSN